MELWMMLYVVGSTILAGSWAWFDDDLDVFNFREVASVGVMSLIWPITIYIFFCVLVVVGIVKLKQAINWRLF